MEFILLGLILLFIGRRNNPEPVPQEVEVVYNPTISRGSSPVVRRREY